MIRKRIYEIIEKSDVTGVSLDEENGGIQTFLDTALQNADDDQKDAEKRQAFDFQAGKAHGRGKTT